jgi:phage head maturation protease
MTTDVEAGAEVRPTSPVEFRSVSEMEVRYAERTIELLLMPYDNDAAVMVHGRPVVESHAPGAYDGVERRVNRVKVNRDHDLARTVGRAVGLHPSRAEGLVGELRIARTPLGDETLGLAEDGALEPSVGFAVMPGGERWVENRSRRRVTRAFLDHIAMVPEGAYEGRVLSVRSVAAAAAGPRVPTPNLDEVLAWMAVVDAGQRSARMMPAE